MSGRAGCGSSTSSPAVSRRRSWLKESARLIWRALWALVAHEGLEFSGYAAFTAILAVFPFMIFLAALAGFLGQAEGTSRFTDATLRFAPPEVVSVLAPVVEEVTSQRRGGLLTFGIVVAVWSASSGLEALRVMLNRSYDARETRPFWRLKLQSMVFVVFGAGIAVLLSLVIVLGPILLHALRLILAPELIGPGLWLAVRYGLASSIGTALVIALHLLLPNCDYRFRQVWPGAVITVVLWLAMATLFSLYVQNFAQYSVIYGSLGGIMLTLLFFYISGVIFAFGAEINAQLAARSGVRRDAGASRTRDPH